MKILNWFKSVKSKLSRGKVPNRKHGAARRGASSMEGAAPQDSQAQNIAEKV